MPPSKKYRAASKGSRSFLPEPLENGEAASSSRRHYCFTRNAKIVELAAKAEQRKKRLTEGKSDFEITQTILTFVSSITA